MAKKENNINKTSLSAIITLITVSLSIVAMVIALIYLGAKIERTRLAYDISIQLQLHRRLSLIKSSYDLEATFMDHEATPMDNNWDEIQPEKVISITGN